VIGAGLAGLSAAEELAGDGWEVRVVEARDRVGGRTWSRTLSVGVTVEMGAEFVLPQNTEVAALAERLGLSLSDRGVRYGSREPRGGLGATMAEMREAAAEIAARLEDPGADGLSARELLDSLALGAAAREAALARLEISAAASADQVPATALEGLAHIGEQPTPSVAGGNQRLALELASRLGDAVRLRDAAVAVEWAAGAARVECASGASHDGDACVVAVPASVIGRIRFDPLLPRTLGEALSEIRYGHAAKLFVPLSETAGPSAVMSVPERYWCWTGSEAPVVSCFAGSAAALEGLEVGTGPGRWLESLARLRPELALAPEGAMLSTWDDDPWIGAAYSIAPRADVTAALAGPSGALTFAGEHTAGPFHALMEGAIRSGRRAARALQARAQ
jgi:monoamine oxidase